MSAKSTLAFLFLGLFLSFSSCTEDEVAELQVSSYTAEDYALLSQTLNLPRYEYSYALGLATHIVNSGAQPPQVNNAKATLGRVLFYDKKLSRNLTVSCASCHKQELAFSDDVAFSKGFAGELTKRNSLALGATANFETSYNDGTSTNSGSKSVLFFWDERAATIADQSILTLQDEIEMGMDLDELAFRLQNEAYYRILFRRAYGSEKVDPALITDALQMFCNTFTSTRSRFDHHFNQISSGQPGVFTTQELKGNELFRENCASCHGGNMTNPGLALANNGLNDDYGDEGVGALTKNAADMGVFKVPFLRNIVLTGPYMHDGRFDTLEEVIDHYSTGVQDHPNLHPNLRDENGQPRRMNFTDSEKDALIAFLKTLTDYEFIKEVRFSDPFLK